MDKTEIHKLENGITVLLTPDANARTACVQVGVGVGANHEADNEHGLAHFFEHMCFKGTKRYPDHTQLLIRMDESGLVGNAYTGREYTAYYLLGRAERLSDMVEITSEIFLHSLFPAEELEKEKGVIVEEIAMYEDDPGDKAGAEVEKSLFAGTVVGHSILGTPESVRSFSRDDFVRFLEKQYVAENTVVSVTGRFDVGAVLTMLEEVYRTAARGAHTEQVRVVPTGVSRVHQSVVRSDLEQSNIVIGGYAASRADALEQRATELFSVVLGGSMSSRLFLRVREQLGACYSISTVLESDTHYGGFYICTGINGKRTSEVMAAIGEECARIRDGKVSEDELRKAREYVLGLRAIKQESRQGVAGRVMHDFLQTGLVESTETFNEYLQQVTPADIKRIANNVLDGKKMSVCYVGNSAIDAGVTETFLGKLG